MIQEATDVGELVQTLAVRGAEGKVKRIFRSSAYLEAEGGLVLLMRGALRSPMTINIDGGEDFAEVLAVGGRFELNPGRLKSGELEVILNRAKIYKSALGGGQPVSPIAEPEMIRAATMLKLLYAVSDASLDLVEGRALEEFAKTVLRPLAGGRVEPAFKMVNYLQLIGSGTGFTPAGDDFIAGFISAFNHAAAGVGERRISLPVSELSNRTVSESATLLDYAQRGYVDEGLELLILAAFGDRPKAFLDELIVLARRGHTSGLDMSLGVLMAAAAMRDRGKRQGALESTLRELRNP
jgi:hypothetical protein